MLLKIPDEEVFWTSKNNMSNSKIWKIQKFKKLQNCRVKIAVYRGSFMLNGMMYVRRNFRYAFISIGRDLAKLIMSVRMPISHPLLFAALFRKQGIFTLYILLSIKVVKLQSVYKNPSHCDFRLYRPFVFVLKHFPSCWNLFLFLKNEVVHRCTASN